MFTVQRKKRRIHETLQLLNEEGTQELTVVVDLDIDQIAARVNKSYEKIGMLQNDLKKNPRDTRTMEAFGQAILEIFKIIFGDDQAMKVLEFYDENYTEMLVDLFPFINEEIMPQVKEASRQRAEQLAKAANASRRGTTLFGRF